MKLKKGDIVKYVSGDAENLTVGKCYHIFDIWHSDGNSFNIIDDDGDSIDCIFPKCAFGRWELVANDK